VAVVIPVKSFTVAKGRLSDILSPPERESLARDCAATVVRASAPHPVYVVCSDPNVAQWARDLGARVVMCGTPGLDNAVAAGREQAQLDGFDHLIVAHADLPLAHSLSHVAIEQRVTIVTDRHCDGTNVLAFPIASAFTTAYGPGSCSNHRQLAETAGIECIMIHDDDLALDLDTADDLSEFTRRKKATP
jgi:2-phospho-L-lactate guanylyltransferase